MLRPSPNHGTQRLPNDDDDDEIDTTLIKSSLFNTSCLLVKLFIRLHLLP